jgi:hypothetical protein
MEQRVSRPVQWRTAINRANNAIGGVLELRSQWMTKLEELRGVLEDLRAQRTCKSQELGDALADLVSLQSDYQFCRDQVPQSLEDTNYVTKLDDVQHFVFEHLRKQVPEDEKFPLEDELEEALNNEYLEEPFIDALAELEEAEAFDLPKGFGRD